VHLRVINAEAIGKSSAGIIVRRHPHADRRSRLALRLAEESPPPPPSASARIAPGGCLVSKVQRPHLLGLNPISGHSFLRRPWGLLSRAQAQGSFPLDGTAHFPGRANERLQPCSERNRAMRASPRSRAARVVPPAPHSHQPSGSSTAPCSPSLPRARGFFYSLNALAMSRAVCWRRSRSPCSACYATCRAPTRARHTRPRVCRPLWQTEAWINRHRTRSARCSRRSGSHQW